MELRHRTITRRRALQGAGAAALLAAGPGLLHAGSGRSAGSTRLGTPAEIRGREIELLVAETPINYNGVTRLATTINGSIHSYCRAHHNAIALDHVRVAIWRV